MDAVTASYYRKLLFFGTADQQTLPPSLILLHAWTYKRFHAIGAGGIISKQVAVSVVLAWLSSTKEGRAFALEHTDIGEMFSDDEDQPIVAGAVDWDQIPVSTPVVAVVDKLKTAGEYMGRRSSYIDMMVGGEKKTFRTNQVQLAGV